MFNSLWRNSLEIYSLKVRILMYFANHYVIECIFSLKKYWYCVSKTVMFLGHFRKSDVVDKYQISFQTIFSPVLTKLAVWLAVIRSHPNSETKVNLTRFCLKFMYINSDIDIFFFSVYSLYWYGINFAITYLGRKISQYKCKCVIVNSLRHCLCFDNSVIPLQYLNFFICIKKNNTEYIICYIIMSIILSEIAYSMHCYISYE